MGDDSLPEVVRSIFNREGIELGGGNSIVNANSWNACEARLRRRRPARRCGWSSTSPTSTRSLWVNSTGQSGHTYDDHYADQIDAWAANETFPWPFGDDGGP